MKKGLSYLIITLLLPLLVASQKNCDTYRYTEKEFSSSASFRKNQQDIEDFTNRFSAQESIPGTQARTTAGSDIIRIPVVVHVLYHYPHQKISDELIKSQIEILTRDFRKRNPDTILTPAVFRPFAADAEIEFYLATSDPKRFSTNGIIKKYTPVLQWKADDKMKFNSEMGSDAWDTKSYLNIWVCSLDGPAGYASLPGGDMLKDGVVTDFNAFGPNGKLEGYDKGRTIVHEVGHWLNLRHIWGDSNCGDDFVQDTPKQDIYTVGCPTGYRTSCNNAPTGNMYMNYMDFTDDACMNLFTKGQKSRMHALFEPGGARASILNSTGLDEPLYISVPSELPDPKWLFTKIYPNPATDKLTINIEYDERWVGKTLNVTNINGQTVMRIVIRSKVFQADISRLQSGTYILSAQKEDGETIRYKFFKM
jgi:hypothetical protein